MHGDCLNTVGFADPPQFQEVFLFIAEAESELDRQGDGDRATRGANYPVRESEITH